MLEFLRRYPKVHIDLVTEGRLVDIVADGFDLGVRAASLIPSDMIVIPLGQTQRYSVVGTPAYFEQHGRPPHATRSASPTVHTHPPAEWCDLPPGISNGQLTLDEPSVAKAAVREGVGLGFFMEMDVQAEIEAGQFERVLEDWTPPRDNLCLYYPNRSNPSAALKAFTILARANLAGKGGPT